MLVTVLYNSYSYYKSKFYSKAMSVLLTILLPNRTTIHSFASGCESKEWSMSAATHLNEEVDRSPVTHHNT